MAGVEVSRYTIDARSIDIILSLRTAFDKVESFAKWLANNPVVEEVDPLVAVFNYTADEAYLIRVTFEQLDVIRTTNTSTFEIARKLTGLD